MALDESGSRRSHAEISDLLRLGYGVYSVHEAHYDGSIELLLELGCTRSVLLTEPILASLKSRRKSIVASLTDLRLSEISRQLVQYS